MRIILEMEDFKPKMYKNIEVRVGMKEMLPNIPRLINKYPNCVSSTLGEALHPEVKLILLDPAVVNIRPYFLNPSMLHKM